MFDVSKKYIYTLNTQQMSPKSEILKNIASFVTSLEPTILSTWLNLKITLVEKVVFGNGSYITHGRFLKIFFDIMYLVFDI